MAYLHEHVPVKVQSERILVCLNKCLKYDTLHYFCIKKLLSLTLNTFSLKNKQPKGQRSLTRVQCAKVKSHFKKFKLIQALMLVLVT